MYAGFPLLCKYQLQTEITLLSTESEYTGLSYTLRKVIPIMQLLKELKKAGFSIEFATPKLTFKVFEDNSGALEMSTLYKHRARTKHLNMKLHYFRDYVTRGEVTILPIGTLETKAHYDGIV